MPDDTRTLKVPELSLVLLVGASGSGKSSFAARHFKATEVISSDYCRGLVSEPISVWFARHRYARVF